MTATVPRRVPSTITFSQADNLTPRPLLALRWGAVTMESLLGLSSDARLEVFVSDAPSPHWIPLAHRSAGLVLAVAAEPMRAFCYALTAGIRVPVFVATRGWRPGERDDLLDAGASACLGLPITTDDVDLLMPRLATHASVAHIDPTLRLVLDPMARVATHGGMSVHLSQREFTLLHCLSSHSGQPVAAEELLMFVWGTKRVSNPRLLLEVNVHELRLKLGRIGLAGAIVTIRRYGYCLSAAQGGRRLNATAERARPAG